MPQIFIQLDKAAEILGVSKLQLSELRESGKVHAYRDGSSWKFKEEEVERIKTNLKELLSNEEDSFDAIDLELIDDDQPEDAAESEVLADFDEEDDSILLSEVELGGSQKGPSSTVIGKNDPKQDPGGDLELSAGSDVSLEGKAPEESSDVLVPDDSQSSKVGAQFEDIEELELDLEAESSQILHSNSKKPSPTSGASDLDLDAEDSVADRSGAMSDVILAGAKEPEDSGLLLEEDEDDELVLGQTSSDSDITLNTGDSGIGLAGPTDSGLSLDDGPIELGGSAVGPLNLEGNETITLEEEADSEAATELRAEDDFLLTPLDDSGAEDSDDDGSQVIPLDSESFDESAATMLGSALPLSNSGLEADLGVELGAPSGFAPAAAPLSGGMSADSAEAPYSVANIVSLVLCLFLLMMTGMMLFDLIRNMWSWNEPYAFNSSIMDALTKAIPIFGK